MIFAIIASIFCFLAAVMMFMPFFKKAALLRPFAVYLIFQGAWILLSYALLSLNPNNALVFPINYTATVLLTAYFIFVMIKTRLKARSKRKRAPDRANTPPKDGN